MGCHYFETADGRVSVHICFINIYKFEGLVFEHHDWHGPTQYKKDMSEPRKNISKNFGNVIKKFEKLNKKEREKYLIYG